VAKVHHIANREALEEAAGRWIARLEADDVSEADQQRFADWLAEDPRHRETFEAMRHSWHRLDALGASAGDSAAATQAPDAVRSRGHRYGWGLAAAVLLAVGLAAWWQLRPPPILEYQTAVGHQLSVSLEDGSTIDLNTDTLIEVNYTDAQRSVRLRRGEAHFSVERDNNRPFVVLAGHGIVRAVGTAFNVHLTDGETVEVTVTEGIVEVTGADRPGSGSSKTASADVAAQPARVTEGQRVRYDRQVGAVAEIPTPQVERRLAWRQGMLSFDGETLEEVVAEVGRYTNVRFVIANPALRELQVGGYFKSTDIDALTDLLDTAFDVEARREGQQIYLTRRHR